MLAASSIAMELTRVTIEESEPSHTTQFRKLFNELLKDSGLKKLIVFVDELDRCSPSQLMQTLEGLRTFLGNERVVFIAAFDRDAVAATIVNARKRDLQQSESDVPYYLTAGEYLDKIFQFQLSLPPQSAHTMRRFALALVEGRMGVWGKLRDSEQLESIVSLLSPAHVRSPRRTKVLLNDFAVNARAFEQLVGGAWIDRADEIAVWTVLQTEFPHLAADMTLEPDLPRYLVDRDVEPARDAFRRMVQRYRSGSDTLDVTTKDVAAEVGKRQHADLLVYLERVSAVRVAFPSSDLIWQTESDAFETFDDQGLIDVLIRVPDRTIRASMRDLSTASEADVGRALSFLGRVAEEEFVTEAKVVANVMGELADRNPTVATRYAGLLTATWRRVMDDDAGLSTSSAALGFARAFARSESADSVARFAQTVQGQVELPQGLLSALVDSIPSERWKDNAETLVGVLPREVSTTLTGLEALLRREDLEASGSLTDDLKVEVSRALEVGEPSVVEPTAATTAARQAALEETERLRKEVSDRREAVSARLSDLEDVWSELKGHGRPRQWLLSLLREIEEHLPAAANLHDNLITRLAEGQSPTNNLHLMVDAYIDRPREASRWQAEGDSNDPTEDLETALAQLLPETIGADGSLVSERIESLVKAFARVGVAPSTIPYLESLADGPPADARNYVLALRSIERRFQVEQARSNLISLIASFAPRADVSNAEKLALANLLDLNLALKLGEELRTSISTLDDTAARACASFLVVFAGELKTRGVDLSIPLAIVRVAQSDPSWPDSMLSWVATGPRFDHLTTVIDSSTLTGLGESEWQRYGRAAGERSTTAAWQFLRSKSAPVAVRSALASSGVGSEAYTLVGGEIAQGESDDVRSRATVEFLGLPHPTRASASAAAEVIKSLAGPSASPRVGDFKYAAELALANAPKFTEVEKAAVRTAIGRFRPPTFGNVRRIMALRAAGL